MTLVECNVFEPRNHSRCTKSVPSLSVESRNKVTPSHLPHICTFTLLIVCNDNNVVIIFTLQVFNKLDGKSNFMAL